MTETFEAREKKIGSIRIVKNPNFPSGTSLQAYIKTNRAELRKVFGNPNMAESGDGKSKGKEWNLIVGSHRVTIYDKRERDKKGTKYFNIGGRGKFGALLVAQALSIHRNERVHAKETVPKWLEDKRHHQQVKSIDEHPDLTYQRAKEYWENTGRYGAESDGFGEYTLPFVGGQRERLEDKIANQLVSIQRVALNKGNDDFLHDIFKEGLSGKPLRKMTDEELIRKNKEVEMDIDSIYGAETFDVEFNEWAEQEMMSHGKDISFKDWAEDEGMKHGDVPITEWAQHEDESHDARYGAENWGGNPKGQLATALRNARIKAKQPKKPLKIEKLGAEYEDCEVCYTTVDKGTLNDVQAGRICNDCHRMNQYAGGTRTIKTPYNAETSGQWEIGEQLEEAQMNAEGKKRNKLSGQLSDPFDELSLDSGDWKGIVAGFGVGLLALFGYSKLRK